MSDRRDELGRIEAGLYEVKLNSYIRFNLSHDTRGKSINLHYNANKENKWKYICLLIEKM